MRISKSKFGNSEAYFNMEDLKVDLRKHAVRGGGITVFAQISVYSIDLIGTIILARLLTPDDFGMVAMVISILWFFFMYRNLGLIDAAIQAKEINHKQMSTLFWVTVAFGIALTLIFIGIAPLIAWFYKKPQLKSIAVVLAFSFFFEGFSTQHQSLLKRNMQFHRYAANDIIAATIGVIVAIILALKGFGYWALVAKRLCLALSTTVGIWFYCKWRPGLPAYGTGAWSLLKFGLNIIGNSSFNYLTKYLDKILIGRYNGALSLGYYDKAYQLFMAPTQQMTIPLTHVAIATLSKLRNDNEKYHYYYINAISMLAFVAMPLCAALTVLSEDIILLLLGPQWNETSKIFAVFGIGIGSQILYSTSTWLHISLGRTDRLFRWAIIGAIVYIASFFIGVSFGPLGIAVAYIVALHILIGPSLWYAGKPINLKLSVIVSAIWKYYLAAVVAAILVRFFLFNIYSGLNIFFRIILSITLLISIYLTIIITLYRNTKPIAQFFSVLADMMPQKKR